MTAEEWRRFAAVGGLDQFMSAQDKRRRAMWIRWGRPEMVAPSVVAELGIPTADDAVVYKYASREAAEAYAASNAEHNGCTSLWIGDTPIGVVGVTRIPLPEIVIVAAAHGPGVRSLDGGDAAGMYLKSYDPDAMDGYGLATWTTDKGEALTFTGSKAAMKFWRQQSTVRPLRDDGHPNRPLTAYMITLEQR